MIKSLQIKNLTVFSEAELQFSPNLNVIIGENGTGKIASFEEELTQSDRYLEGPV